MSGNIENKLLNVLKNRSDYEKYRHYIPLDYLGPISRRLLGYLDKYWEDYPNETGFDWSDFQVYLDTVGRTDPHFDAISQVLRTSDSIRSTEAARDVLNKAVERDVSEQIQGILERDTFDPVAIRELVDDYETFVSSDLDAIPNEVPVELDAVLSHSHINEPGLPFSLLCLQHSVGPLRAGDTVYIPARPEVGKTTFLVHQSGYMMENSEGTNTIIFSNEEDGNRVMLRLYQSVLNWTTKDILADPKKAQQEYINKLGSSDRIRVVHSSTLHRRECERAIAKYDPDLIVFNLLSNIKGFSDKYSQNDVETHEAQGVWMRELANGYGCAAMTGWQAGGHAHGKEWIEQDDMYMSKTGIVGAADVILGIGRRIDPSTPDNVRFLHLSKNKLPGDNNTLEHLRHGYFDEIYLDSERGRYRER